MLYFYHEPCEIRLSSFSFFFLPCDKDCREHRMNWKRKECENAPPIPFSSKCRASPTAWLLGSLSIFHWANCSQVKPSCWSSHWKGRTKEKAVKDQANSFTFLVVSTSYFSNQVSFFLGQKKMLAVSHTHIHMHARPHTYTPANSIKQYSFLF